jgi:hypothetical protein
VGIDYVPTAIEAAAASREEVETAFAGWEMLVVEPADTAVSVWPSADPLDREVLT